MRAQPIVGVPGQHGGLLAVHGEDQCHRHVDTAESHAGLDEVAQAAPESSAVRRHEQPEQTGAAHLVQRRHGEHGIGVAAVRVLVRDRARRAHGLA